MNGKLKKLSLGLAIFLALSQVSYAKDMMQIKGSDTLINLVQRLAEVYMEKNPGKYIAVTGGGSGTGVAALINGKCDIANSSRNMEPKEIEQAMSVNVNPQRAVIAMDGLTVVINASNPVDKLTVDQIGKIFRGEITNWKDVGGQDMSINLYGRQSNSGTYVFFRDVVLAGEYSQHMNHMNGNAQIIESVKQDASGIGYVGVGYGKDVTGITVVKVAGRPGGEYSSPLNTADVLSGKYPIARPLNQYINGTPSERIKDFINFELSEEGQKIAEEEGFFRIPGEYVEFNKRLGL